MIHRTRGGDTMFISQIEDDHLLNTVKMHCKNISTAMNIIKNGSMETIDSIMSGYSPQQTTNEAKQIIKTEGEQLAFYVIECNIRGIDVKELLQGTYGRKEKTG